MADIAEHAPYSCSQAMWLIVSLYHTYRSFYRSFYLSFQMYRTEVLILPLMLYPINRWQEHVRSNFASFFKKAFSDSLMAHPCCPRLHGMATTYGYQHGLLIRKKGSGARNTYGGASSGTGPHCMMGQRCLGLLVPGAVQELRPHLHT